MKNSYVSPLPELLCNICNSPQVALLPPFAALRQVTSDCRPWQAGGQLGICRNCGCIQKPVTPQWLAEIERIYDAYSIYHQGDGVEQSVFDDASGKPMPRSERLFSQFKANTNLLESGRLLDIGCGNGAFLSVFSRMMPGWKMAGVDLSDKYRHVVEKIDRVEALFLGELEDIPGVFDMISMIYVLEHMVAPRDYLARVCSKLKDGGLLLIEVPDFDQNPFDLLIADHCSYFTGPVLAGLLKSAGFEVLSVATRWVPKGLTTVARKGSCQTNVFKRQENTIADQPLAASVDWLGQVVRIGHKVSSGGEFGIFGTGIAATWLSGELGDAVSFFVDEDPNRSGKKYLDKPIYHPKDVPPEGNVYIALPLHMARQIKKRLEGDNYPFTCYLPEEM